MQVPWSHPEWDSVWSLLAVGQRRVLEVEGRLSHERGLARKGTGQVARVKGSPVEIKALVLEKYSGMNVREWKPRRSLSLEKW